MLKTITISAAIITLSLLSAIWLVTSQYWLFSKKSNDRFASCRSSKVLGGSENLGGPFTLVNADGETVTDKEVITEASLIYFGYTFCPDVCPLDSARNSEVVDLLADAGFAATPIFISIDPKRDTPEVIAEFSKWLHPKMIGLTGSPEQVKAASKAYRTYFKAHDNSDDDFYLVDHTTMSYLVLPEYGFVEFFRRDQSAKLIAKTAACFISKS